MRDASEGPAATPPPALPPETADRFPGLDALRAAAAVAVISIHVTLAPDSFRTNFWADLGFRDRFLNHFGDSLSRFAVASFVAASFFLLARSLDRRPEPYPAVVRKRFARILPAYLFWSAVYMVVQGLRTRPDGFAWVTDPAAWAKALLAGIPPNMYHIWFLPMLLALSLAYPVVRALARGPFALSTAAAAALLALRHYLDGRPPALLVGTPLIDFWWRITAVVGYAGFATIGWSAYRALAAKISAAERRALVGAGAVALGFALVVFALKAAAQARTVDLLPERPLDLAALYAYPAGVFALFVFSERGLRGSLPPRVARLAEISYGIYLTHPLALMVFDPLESRGINTAAHGLWVAKIAIALALSWVLTAAMLRSRALGRFVR